MVGPDPLRVALGCDGARVAATPQQLSAFFFSFFPPKNVQQKAEKRLDMQGILLTFIIPLQPLNRRCITFTGKKKNKTAAYLGVFTALFANISAAFIH